MRVFLGGTCNGSTWRDTLIPMLTCDYFNPVVEDWTPECQEIELFERETCDYVLYVITPRMKGVYSIAEVVDDSNKRPEKTILCVIHDEGEFHNTVVVAESLMAVERMVLSNSATVLTSLPAVAEFLNNQ